MTNFSTYSLVSLTVLLSSLPVLIWGAIFLYKSEEKRYMISRTFFIGALMVIPLIVYRELWSLFPAIDLVKNLEPLADFKFGPTNLGLNLIVLYASIGIIEEYLKNLAVKKVDTKELNSIKDCIELSIIAALGFSFAENTFYFIHIYHSFGINMLLEVFVFRSLFSTFAHILFSAVYGYHFGLAIFAKDIYKKKQENSFASKLIYKFFNLFKKTNQADIFEDKHKFLGLLYAASLHAIFNLLLEIGITIFLVPFLLIGVVHVSYLVYKRENHIVYLPETK